MNSGRWRVVQVRVAGNIRNATGALLVSSTLYAATGQLPADLVPLVEAARLSGKVTAWCEVQGAPRGTRHVAVAASSPSRSEYLVLRRGGAPYRLAAFQGAGELACYASQQARDLDRSIRQSATIEGGVQPRSDATVVCAFTEQTSAVCWQYSPGDRGYVQVGRWST